jgi:CheY-like chemotaxis protein
LTLEPEHGQRRILVVDDHAISGHHAVTALSLCPGKVRWSKTATAALELALDWLPHLIFMDLHLQNSNGLELLNRIREKWPAHRPGPKIIVTTGDDSVQARSDLAALNIEHWLLKPVSGQQLRTAAGLAHSSEIGESRTGKRHEELPVLFRAELRQRLPELDSCLSEPGRRKAVTILHQLIASAAMCGESRLESSLRILDKVCRHEEIHGDVAMCYHAFLETAREFMSRAAPR